MVRAIFIGVINHAGEPGRGALVPPISQTDPLDQNGQKTGTRNTAAAMNNNNIGSPSFQ